ncbi:hypothetical protein CHS0354_018731 [Potamilus streckersoni]|uniref:Uncharacterized protein n=1 Tax=Potamilus streckersoni TaxID=2493646 RepID=A0AAE0T311_9BIVA|nr:hypothetical protein CHS0354_018731 [Potamilus streckersoni]
MLFRVIVVGDPYVGKSSIVRYFKEGKPNDAIQSTTQPDLIVAGIELKNKVKAKFEIFDTAGQEIYGSLTRSYYRDKDGVLIVYNVTDRKSFDNVQRWLEEAKIHLPGMTNIYIVGNMIDKNERRISTAEGKHRAEYLDLKHFETSAKDGRNIVDVFMSLAEDIYVQKMERPEYHQSIVKIEDDFQSNKDQSNSTSCSC